MASVPSLDKDLRNMRLDKYTPQRANETRSWIEEMLGTRLAQGDLLESLKDGIALCELINLATPGGVRYKKSNMPFVQMENISHFLRACQAPPLSLPAHDCFLTVDLYESKDPAQVLQCIESFSRKANAVNPTGITRPISGRKTGLMSPQGTGPDIGRATTPVSRGRGVSNASDASNTASGRVSPVKNGTISPNSSSWAKRGDMGATAPAWNIAQYGWTGGASQGNQGISFGARRQITTASPKVPSLAEKERKRKEKEAEEERLRQQAEEAEHQRRIEQQAEEERQEQQRQEKVLRRKDEERQAAEEEKRRWYEEERKWRQEEEARIREEKEHDARLEKDREQKRTADDKRLKGQSLSRYQSEQKAPSSESNRIQELERQLAEAKEREARYERERQEQQKAKASAPIEAPAPLSIRHLAKEDNLEFDGSDDSFQTSSRNQASERDFLRQAWSHNQATPQQPPRPATEVAPPQPPRPTEAFPVETSSPVQTPPPAQPPRPLPVPQAKPAVSSRPLPNPAAYASQTSTPNRTDRFLSSNPAPAPAPAASHTPSEAAYNSMSERAAEDSRRLASQQKTKPGGWASKSLLEREMERERERQREWEESQKQTKDNADKGLVDPNAGSGPGGSWDVNSYGYTKGDNMNQGGHGIYSGRRQLGGPRPLVKKN